MIQRADGQPLISRALAGIILGALVVPMLTGVLWIRGWISTVDQKLETVISNQIQTRAEMYPRSEANLQWQRIDDIRATRNQQIDEIKQRVNVLETRARTQRDDFPRADQSEVRRLRP